MVARLWNGSSLARNADAYVAHLNTRVIPQLAGIDGYRGIHVLRKDRADVVDFIVMTFWESLDAIRRFAGPDAEVAVIAPEARDLLVRYDSRASHFEVVASSGT